MATNLGFVTELKRDTPRWDEPLRQRLVAYRTKYGVSYKDISRDMQRFYARSGNVGMGESTIRAYVDCKYESGQEALERLESRLRGWLDHREHGGRVDEVDESLYAAKLIQHGLLEADEYKKFVSIIAPSGLGKSLMAKHLANKNLARTSMIIVEAYDGITPRAFLSNVCRALGETDTGSKDLLLNRVAGRLSEQPRLVIVDEANFLKPESLNHLVFVRNRAEIGIALLGTEELERAIFSSSLQRIRSRLRVAISIGALTKEEIRKRLEEVFDPREVTERVVDLAATGSLGSYRKLDDLITKISDEKEKKPGASLQSFFERYYTSREGRQKR